MSRGLQITNSKSQIANSKSQLATDILLHHFLRRLQADRAAVAFLQCAGEPGGAELPDHRGGLADDVARHLRDAASPVDEDDWYLLYHPAQRPDKEVDLDLERVAVGADTAQIDLLEHLGTKALEAAGGVVK